MTGFEAGEVPVGCVFVRFDAESKNKYEIIARAHNLTNLTKDATRHCEMLCINEVLKKQNANYDAEKVFEDAVLYVTVEPCIMCGYALNLMKIKKVYFGCWNDRFGGNGSIIDTQKMAPHHYETIGGLKEEEAKNMLRKFYEKGNENLPEEMRHRTKKIKGEEEK